MSHPPVRLLAVAAAVAGLVLLAGCAPDSEPSTTAAPSASGTADASATPTASPSPTVTAAATPAMPTDCRSILSEPVLAELAGVPLNDPATGETTGVQADGSLVCLWKDPAADTSHLLTTISKMASGPALDMLNSLVADNGFSCFTPDKGTRCEKTWQNTTYPVTDGRTLFYRDGLLVDTKYSNLAPSGYTSSIIERVFG
ncbi:hypothetical protein ACFXP7_13420 [Microbacterium sp. P06]|uniref:hypothetical protein n=1 Tax=Microbacterium sp. P06 TaxID=3366949 RepID=UPI0037466CE4